MGIESAGAPKEQSNNESVSPIFVDLEKTFDYGTSADRLAAGLGSGGMGEITVPGAGDEDAPAPNFRGQEDAERNAEETIVDMALGGFFTVDDEGASRMLQRYFGKTLEQVRAEAANGETEPPAAPATDDVRERFVIIDEPGGIFDNSPAGQVDARAYIHPTPQEKPNAQE